MNIKIQSITPDSEDYPSLLKKTSQQKVIATDLARLYSLQDGLRQGYATVIWCDADFLIFAPAGLSDLPQEQYAFGREVWIDHST